MYLYSEPETIAMRKFHLYILPLMLIAFSLIAKAQGTDRSLMIDYYDGYLQIPLSANADISVKNTPTAESVRAFYNAIIKSDFKEVADSLLAYKKEKQLNDWLYYQLIRRTAQEIAPKQENYTRYTLYKWYLLCLSGFDARVAIANNKIIFYVYNNENIEDIPFFEVGNKKYTCLNIHDYPKADLQQDAPIPVRLHIDGADQAFSYKVTQMPDFKPTSYTEKQLAFNYKHKMYHFEVKLNPEVEAIFKNYPGVDFGSYFNIPLSRETYSSLIPMLKKNIKGMKTQKGIDYLMRFTRYAFLYEDDEANFGKEKRMSAEETLFSKYSDCDDRAALFFYLVKEIYNLPMIAILYPTHITMAVQLDKTVGTPIVYNGKSYSICEPTLQKKDLKIGELSDNLKNESYQIVYHYDPK